jgi:hypothetical protein
MFEIIENNELEPSLSKYFNGKRDFSNDEWLIILKYFGVSIKDIKDPSEEMKMEAVKSSPSSIQYIKDPSEELQLIAMNEWFVIMYINDPTDKVQLKSVNLFKQSLENFKEEQSVFKNRDYQLDYIKLIFYDYLINYIKNHHKFETKWLDSIASKKAIDYYNNNK